MLFSVFVGSKPIFARSALSAHCAFSRAAASRRPISFLSRSFSASSYLSRRSLFSSHVEKSPWVTSISARFIERMWSTQPSRNARSCETRMKPRLRRRYRATRSRPASSRWFVGSSISRKSSSLVNIAASWSFVRSPPESESNGRSSSASSSPSMAISRRRRHSSPSLTTSASASAAGRAVSCSAIGK